MSEEFPLWERQRSFMNNNWDVFYVIDEPFRSPALVFEHDIGFEGRTVTKIPVTARRAKALIRLLHDMLVELGELDEPPIVKPPDGYISLMDSPQPLYPSDEPPRGDK